MMHIFLSLSYALKKDDCSLIQCTVILRFGVKNFVQKLLNCPVTQRPKHFQFTTHWFWTGTHDFSFNESQDSL